MPLAVADDWTIQESFQQLAIGDDRCGEIDLVYAAEKNGFIVSDPAMDPDSPLAYETMLRRFLGKDDMEGGTTLAEEYQASIQLAKLLQCDVYAVPILPQPNANFNMADWPGWWLILATKLGYIVNPRDPANANVQGDHFLLFDGNIGRMFHCLDSCHDVDGALGHPDGYLNMDDVLKGSVALLGSDSICGYLVRYFQPGETIAMPTNPPDNMTLQNQNGLNAQAGYDLGLAMDAIIRGDTATALKLLHDGPTSVFGQINAISPAQFPVPPRPQ